MAWARKLPSGKWQGCYRNAAGELKTAGAFLRKSDAKDAAAEEERKIRRGEWIDPALRRITFGDYALSWLETKGNVRPRTRINVEGRLRNHILPAFEDSLLIAVEPSDVRGWLATLNQRGLAASTVKATYRTFSQIMRTAEIDGLLSRSPCLGVELPKEGPGEEMHFLSPEQVTALADAHIDRYRVAIYTAAYTGLRAGELWALRLNNTNLLKRSLSVTEALSEVRGRLVVGPTKTRTRRTVSLPSFLTEMIGKHIGDYPSEDGYVFTAPEGGRVRHRNFMDRHFYPACRRAGLEGLRFHDLRHTCAAILIAQGWNAKQVQERLGNASIRTTLDRYAHLFEGHDAVLLERLDASFTRRKLSEVRSLDAPP